MMTRQRILRSMLPFFAALIASCGGGGGGGAPAIMAPSDLQYPAPPAFVVQQPISALSPSVAGQVTSYAVSPALPAGLSLNSGTGVISGTPTAIVVKTTYTVTAQNSGGTTTAKLSLVVNDVKPSITYPSPYFAFTAGVAAQSITPTHSGGAVVNWSIAPALPPGLSFSATSGSIAGTPTAAAAAAAYVVTATNSGGQSPVSLTIGVAAAPLLDLGHADAVILIRPTATDVLSLDFAGHWVLQDIASGTTLASGDGACATGMCPQNQNTSFTHLPVDLAGTTMIDVAPSGLEVRSASDGHLLATILGQFSWYQLAADGSYISAGSPTALTAWTTSGQSLLSRPGNYAAAITFSAPGQIQVARGAAGQSVIETIAIATGASILSPAFQGTFNSWFLDGGRFLTFLGTTVWTYSSAGIQQDVTQVTATSNLAGEGNWLWTFDYTSVLNVYQVGASTSPALSGQFGGISSLIFPSGTTIGIVSQVQGQVTVFDLSGSTPASAVYTVPMDYLYAYGATSSTEWFAADESGVVFDGASLSSQPRFLTLGAARSIAGGAGYFSVATASGEIFNYDANSDALVGTIPFSSAQLSLSSSGTVLAALAHSDYSQYEPDVSVNIYALPAGTVTTSFPYSVNTVPTPIGLSLSGSGTVLAVNFALPYSPCSSQVFPINGGASIWCGIDTTFLDPQLSPDGTLIAVQNGGGSADSTNIYKNGVLATAVPGWAIGWLDNGRVLAITFDAKNNYTGSVIYGPLGNVLATSPVPEMYAFDVATPNTVYSPELNAIVSLTTGAPTWASANSARRMGAITNSQVIFASGSLVLAQPY